jgi:hypothetical protein
MTAKCQLRRNLGSKSQPSTNYVHNMGLPMKNVCLPRRDEGRIKGWPKMMDPALSAIWSAQTEFKEKISKQVEVFLVLID